MKRPAAIAELLTLVDWLIAHNDSGGLACMIESLDLDVAARPWSAAGVRALFTVIAYYAPAGQFEAMLSTAKDCRETVVEIETTHEAARLLATLGVDEDKVEQLVRDRKR